MPRLKVVIKFKDAEVEVEDQSLDLNSIAGMIKKLRNGNNHASNDFELETVKPSGEKFPSPKDVKEFILANLDNGFSFRTFSQHFIGKVPNARGSDMTFYHKLKGLMNKAMKRIEKEENGTFQKKGKDELDKARTFDFFKFQRDIESLNSYRTRGNSIDK